MGYQALYRVWRPQTFADVVGQEHVTKTLQNALLQQKISHAYLFTGPRGTGKTSAAKILAKAVNCERGPAGEPCDECAVCKGITDGSIPDVIEIDAASNNGVEEIRDIRDKVKFAPSVTKYKVYIIDEVHMLTIGAFNALLKTLEEPPKHVIFILATTEPHKIPLTIISRCQRFDFKRITPEAIEGRLRQIVEEYGYSYDEKALQLIARAAEGGLRDALSLLDQTISYSNDRISIEDALTITGSVSQQILNDVAYAILENDTQQALESLHTLLAEGKDPTRIVEEMIQYFRDLLLFKSSPNIDHFLEKVTVDEKFENLAEQFDDSVVFDIIDRLNQTQSEMKWTNHPKIILEVLFVQLTQRKGHHGNQTSLAEIDELREKISILEQQLKTIQQNGATVAATAEQTPKENRPVRSVKSGYKAPVGKIENILTNATKQDLQLVKTNWPDIKDKLKKSHAALLNDAEPVAASSTGCVVKFKYEIHCQMAMKNSEFIAVMNNALLSMTNKPMEVIGVPEDQWGDIRKSFISQHQDIMKDSPQEQEVDPLIEEAKKLVGEDLLEIKD